jgi:hypothetical protein
VLSAASRENSDSWKSLILGEERLYNLLWKNLVNEVRYSLDVSLKRMESEFSSVFIPLLLHHPQALLYFVSIESGQQELCKYLCLIPKPSEVHTGKTLI